MVTVDRRWSRRRWRLSRDPATRVRWSG